MWAWTETWEEESGQITSSSGVPIHFSVGSVVGFRWNEEVEEVKLSSLVSWRDVLYAVNLKRCAWLGRFRKDRSKCCFMRKFVP